MTVTTTLRCTTTGCTAVWAQDGWPKDVKHRARRAGWDVRQVRCPAHLDAPESLTLFDMEAR